MWKSTHTDQDQELERIRIRLKRLLGARLAMGLNEADEREYAELCHRERELMQAPAIVDVNGRVVDLDADVESGWQRQDR